MNRLDFLLEIRKEFEARVCNYGLQSVLTERKWQELVYKCICAGITEDEIEKLKEKGLSEREINEILRIGKDCGTCLGESNDQKRED